MAAQRPHSLSLDLKVGPLEEQHLDEADRVLRLAFGTFLGLPDPLRWLADADYIHSRWRARHTACFGAWVEDRLVGSVIVSNWGSVGYFGPLSVHPELWDKGVATALMEPVLATFHQAQCRHAGLFTFANSAKHVGLYNKFGFAPRFLTALMTKTVTAQPPFVPIRLFSQLSDDHRQGALNQCREITGAIYPGMDLTGEILSVQEQHLGDTLLLEGSQGIGGFAVCQFGRGSEAASGLLYVKFAAIRPGQRAPADFVTLLQAAEHAAHQQGLSRIDAGVNTSRYEAFQEILSNGFRIDRLGVTMHRAHDAGYHRPGIFVIDDWR